MENLALDEYVTKQSLTATFALTDPSYVLSMSISRQVHKDEYRNGCYDISCALYGRVHHADKNKENDAPSFSFSVWMSTICDDKPEMSRIDFTASHNGIRLHTDGGEVRQIDKNERDRLLEFLKNLRGYSINYTADLFGFLKKDDSDKSVLIELPFPRIEYAK